MTPQQIDLVKSSFAAAAPQRARLSRIFFAELFAREPSLRPLLQDGAAGPASELFEGLAAIVASLGRLYPILPALEWLGARNALRGIGERHYRAVEAALLAALAAGLGEDFTPRLRDSWTAASRRISAVMIEAAEGGALAA